MEQLIEILIRLIASLFENRPATRTPAPRPAPPGFAPAPTQPGRLQPLNRAVVTSKMPNARRAVRRPPPSIAIAKPILANLRPLPAVPPAKTAATTAVVRTASAKAIVAPNTIPPQSAAAIRKWLTPATLKQQFLLTEILQAPLALRQQSPNQPD
jgi:hypothetical protein